MSNKKKKSKASGKPASPELLSADSRTAAAVQDRGAEQADASAPAGSPLRDTPAPQQGHDSPAPQQGGDSPVLSFFRSAGAKGQRARRRWRHIVHEKRAKNFPESERALIQLVLFGWGLLPMLGSRLREGLHSVRTRIHNRVNLVYDWLGSHTRKFHPVLFLAGACCLAAVALFFSAYTFGTTVSYDGEVIASVGSRSAAEKARTALERVTTHTLGEDYTIGDDHLLYSSHFLPRRDVVDSETFKEELSAEIGLVSPAYCLYVDGEVVGATPYEGALEELLEQMKSSATNADTISISFAENVEIKYEYVPSEKVMNLGYLAEMLYSTKVADVTYEVKKGDTWSEIAEAHGLTSRELLTLNPGYNIDKLQIGELLTLSSAVPYLTMTVVQQERYVEDLPYDIHYTDSEYLYKGDYKVTSPGKYGAADILANVTYVNGQEIQRTLLSSVTLQEPVMEERLQGTKERPTRAPTGTFRWPTSGHITSRFGPRRSPGGIGSRNHKGIDIANRRGTPIYAADGGVVTYAGWMGGYGYLVRIDHGNGYTTYYAHNSSLLVSVGEHVYKGQQISRMGSTGNSTGSHCHFEVRYKGVPKNPMNYLP